MMGSLLIHGWYWDTNQCSKDIFQQEMHVCEAKLRYIEQCCWIAADSRAHLGFARTLWDLLIYQPLRHPSADQVCAEQLPSKMWRSGKREGTDGPELAAPSMLFPMWVISISAFLEMASSSV